MFKSNNLMKLLNHILLKPSLYFFLFLIIFTIDRHNRYEQSKDDRGTFYSDVEEYYRFLPDIFINDPKISEPFIKTNRRTLGMAILYSPAFICGHLMAKYEGYVQDGYSKPYQRSIRWGSIIYVLIGLVFCRKSLLIYFSEIVTLIALVCILFGTNLFYYTYSWGELPHSYLFCLYSIFIFCTLKWITETKPYYLLLIAFFGGMITLIRPTGILVLMFPLIFNINSKQEFYSRIKYIFNKPINTYLSILLFCIPLLVQMFFWKKHIGQFVYYSYGKEGFFFNDPQIVNFLFSIRKGWLVYTPIMFFALFGMIISYKNLRPFFVFNILFFILTVYILSSWWEWSYGGSFGCRALIEYYAFFIFPLASFISWAVNNGIKNRFWHITAQTGPLIFFYLLIRFNFFQSWQVRCSIIHWSGMNIDAYKYVFLKKEFTKDDYKYLDSIITPPNAEKMLRGERDF